MINLVTSFPVASIQEISQRGWQDNTITVGSGLLSQSSSTPVGLRQDWVFPQQVDQLAFTKQPYCSDDIRVAPKQTGTGKAIHVDSGLVNEFITVLSHHLVGKLDMNSVHRGFTNLSVHHPCELLQLFHQLRLDGLKASSVTFPLLWRS